MTALWTLAVVAVIVAVIVVVVWLLTRPDLSKMYRHPEDWHGTEEYRTHKAEPHEHWPLPLRFFLRLMILGETAWQWRTRQITRLRQLLRRKQ